MNTCFGCTTDGSGETFDWYQVIKIVIHSLKKLFIYYLFKFSFDNVGQLEGIGINAIENKKVHNRLRYVT